MIAELQKLLELKKKEIVNHWSLANIISLLYQFFEAWWHHMPS